MNAHIPEDSDDLDYIWSIVNQPDASLLNLSAFDYSENRSTVTFIPDKSGKYELEVNVFQYGDELSVQTFIIDIEEGDTAPPPVEPVSKEEEWVEDDRDNKWFEEEEIIIEETVQEISEVTEVAEAIDVIEEAVDVVIIEKAPPPPPPSPKPVIRPGSTIPKISERFTIQVASKKVLSDAEIVAAGLIDNGYDAYIQKAYFKETDEVWFRIRIGSYDSRETATQVAKSISKKRGLSTWVDFVRYEE
ncbi:MAG: SPOR domain-containing protein [Candidatus Marinimicrobia bacterium]|nr:SPOR domain-containing protein [Candidatus Neomarinimicrobiota bacterium]